MLAQIQVFIETALSVLLLLGIAYNFHISRTLSALKSDRASMIKLIEKLESSIKNAHDGVEKLRVAGQVSGRPLSRTIEQAKIVGSELDTLVDKADSKAEQLSVLTRKAETSEQALGKLLDDASDVKLDMLRQVEAPIVQDEAEAVTNLDCDFQADLNSRPSTQQAQEKQSSAKSVSIEAEKNKSAFSRDRQRFGSKFLGDQPI